MVNLHDLPKQPRRYRIVFPDGDDYCGITIHMRLCWKGFVEVWEAGAAAPAMQAAYDKHGLADLELLLYDDVNSLLHPDRMGFELLAMFERGYGSLNAFRPAPRYIDDRLKAERLNVSMMRASMRERYLLKVAAQEETS